MDTREIVLDRSVKGRSWERWGVLCGTRLDGGLDRREHITKRWLWGAVLRARSSTWGHAQEEFRITKGKRP